VPTDVQNTISATLLNSYSDTTPHVHSETSMQLPVHTRIPRAGPRDIQETAAHVPLPNTLIQLIPPSSPSNMQLSFTCSRFTPWVSLHPHGKPRSSPTQDAPAKREKTNTMARPGLRVYAALRRTPPSPHHRVDTFFLSFFCLFTNIFSLCLHITFALRTG
jgi:hypothetical protein